jgi:hypothetical protein
MNFKLKIICFILIVFIGCKEDQKHFFNHKLHIDNGATCDICHADVPTLEKAEMPTAETCLACHEDMDKEKPENKRISYYVSKLKDAKWDTYSHLKDDIKFSHKTHLSQELKCEQCHNGILENTKITKKQAPTQYTCLNCHLSLRGRKAKAISSEVKQTSEIAALTSFARNDLLDCVTCHKTIRDNEKPENHNKNWIKVHGKNVRAIHELSNKHNMTACSLCHEESKCMTCHKDTKPANHNLFFKQRGHSIQAGIDRSNCLICHETSYCEQCHQTGGATPNSHKGDWALLDHTQLSTNCADCHGATNSIALRQNGCITCHKIVAP